MLIEIHMLQNHSPSNLNRDDLGAPKTCLFGDVPRARISSQCLKRSIRNPGNPDDVHKREPGMFAKAMSEHIGTKTKFFPWLVRQALAGSPIPQDEHRRIEFAAQRIAATREKDEKTAGAGGKADPRPRTAQLIHLGPGHAEFFVARLGELREQSRDCYDYFLNPIAGFREMVREHPAVSGLEKKVQDKIVTASWLIAKCRMGHLLVAPPGEEADPEPPMEDDQPGAAHAELVAERLPELLISSTDLFKGLTKAPTKDEKTQLKEEAPDKPPKMDAFMDALKAANRCDAVDIALFGRMTTSEAFEDVGAAMQVAHAISTHRVINEVDYFTAVDDLAKDAGAGHVGEAVYNSACFYKYFCLDWDQLVHNLAGPEPKKPEGEGDDSPKTQQWRQEHRKWTDEVKPNARRLAACTLGHFLRAAVQTTPSGKRNSFAHNNEPCGILVEIKETKTPTSYANAFAEPVERIGKPDDDAPDEQSVEGRSVACLADHVQALRNAYGTDSTLLWYSPKLWRYPLRYWERDESGKRITAKHVTEQRLDVLGGEDGKPNGLVEAVVEGLKLGIAWSGIRDAGKAPNEEA